MQIGVSSVEKLSLLFELNRSFSSLVEPKALLSSIMAKSNAVFQVESCAILLLNETGQELSFPVISGVGPERAERFREVRFPADQGIAGWVLRHRESALVPDVTCDARFYAAVDQATGTRTRDLLCTPLQTRHGVIGVIELCNKKEGIFTQDDLAFLETLSGPIAMAIENARLHQQLQQAEAPSASSSQSEILVVDADLDHRQHVDTLLRAMGCKVRIASNGEEALHQVALERPDCVLLDAVLPIQSGFEVCKTLKQNVATRSIPVVLMTALGRIEDRLQGIEAGADELLAKPFSRDELRARIHLSHYDLQPSEMRAETRAETEGSPPPTAVSAANGPLYLTIRREDDEIDVDLMETGPVVPHGRLQIEESLLTEIGEELSKITAVANQQVMQDAAATSVDTTRPGAFDAELQRLGKLIFSYLFPIATQQKLAHAEPGDLFLRLDDQLVHVPWELAFDGQDFLLGKFNIGRQVITRHQLPSPPSRRSAPTELPKMLIIADPTENLPGSEAEAQQLCELLDTDDRLDVSIMGGKQLRKLQLIQALNEFDLVHYAGHAYFDADDPSRSGWVLHDAVLTASELSRVTDPPLLVFANACQAGVTSPWEGNAAYEGQAFGIGSAFLLAGTQNYIGTFCVIHDTHSATFAATVYRHLLQGEHLGAALAAARRQARLAAGQNGLLWASYMHYGNPAFRLPMHEVDRPLC